MSTDIERPRDSVEPNSSSNLMGGQESMAPHTRDPVLALPQSALMPPHKVWPFILTIQRFRDKIHLRPLFVEAIASFWFIFILVMSVGGYILDTALQPATGLPPLGNWTTTLLSLWLAVAFGGFIAGPVSGGHLAPTITITLAIWRGFPWKYVPLYILAQFAGAIFAAICFYGLESPFLNVIFKDSYSNRAITSAPLFVNLPRLGSPFLNHGHLFINEFFGCLIFMFILSALIDQRNPLHMPKATPFLAGAAVFMVANTFGWTTFVLNPFRDFGPRVYLSAYYSGLWSDSYWAIALFTPFAGHIIGMLLYDVMVGRNYDGSSKKKTTGAAPNKA